MTALEPPETRPGYIVQANGLDIYVEEQGQGQPLLLIHGGIVTAASWRPYVAGLAAHYRVITPDTRGHGRTTNPTGQMSFRLLADDVAALVQALDLRQPLIGGYSDGGQVALEIGMRYPDLPQALIIGGAYGELTEASRQWVRSALGDAESPDVDTAQFALDNPDFAAMLQRLHGPAWLALLRQIKPMWNATLNYTPEDFARVIAPTLVLMGDRDGFVPIEEGVAMYRRLPQAELTVIPNAAHEDFFTAPATVALLQPILLDFLRRHSATKVPSA